MRASLSSGGSHYTGAHLITFTGRHQRRETHLVAGALLSRKPLGAVVIGVKVCETSRASVRQKSSRARRTYVGEICRQTKGGSSN